MEAGGPWETILTCEWKMSVVYKRKILYPLPPEMASLNSKSEIYANCRHKRSKLLIKPKRKKTPGRRPG